MDILVLTQQSGILKPFAIVLGYIMNYIYRFLEHFGISNVALTIILFTLVVNVLMIPLTVRQQKFSKMSSIMNPELQKIQKKYEGKRDERSMRMQQAETQAVYDKYGASPAGGCLPMLIQLPILLALYRVIYNVPAYVQPIKDVYESIATPIMNTSGADSIMQTLISDMSLRVSNFDITNIDKIIDALYLVKSTGWETVSSAFASSSDVVNAIATYSPQIIKMNSIVGGLTISDPPVIFSNGLTGIFPGILIPLLAAASQWVQMKVSTKNQKIDLDTQMGSTMNTMNMMMPLMSLFFCTTLPAGIGIYWIASAVIRTIFYVLIDKFSEQNPEQIIEANKEKAAMKAEKRKEQAEKLESYAAMNTRNIDRKSLSQLAKTSVEGKGDMAKSKLKDDDSASSSVSRKTKTEGKGSVSDFAHILDNKRK